MNIHNVLVALASPIILQVAFCQKPVMLMNRIGPSTSHRDNLLDNSIGNSNHKVDFVI